MSLLPSLCGITCQGSPQVHRKDTPCIPVKTGEDLHLKGTEKIIYKSSKEDALKKERSGTYSQEEYSSKYSKTETGILTCAAHMHKTAGDKSTLF